MNGRPRVTKDAITFQICVVEEENGHHSFGQVDSVLATWSASDWQDPVVRWTVYLLHDQLATNRTLNEIRQYSTRSLHC
jgi:hypothetical protein